MGKAWARYMPKVSVFGISLNPGPFTIKEHVIATVMASVSNQPAYAVGAERILSTLFTVFLTLLSGLYHFGPEGLVQSAPKLYMYVSSAHAFHFEQFLYQNRPVVVPYVNPADWLFNWWDLPKGPRCTRVYDMAREPRCMCDLQHFARSGHGR
jgi:hypothetical protein